MQVQQKQDNNKGSFYIEEAGTTVAEITYSMTGSELMIIDHTEVADELRGKNVGQQLVNAAVEYAREKHIKIIPLCPFVKSVFDKKASAFGDVLKGN